MMMYEGLKKRLVPLLEVTEASVATFCYHMPAGQRGQAEKLQIPINSHHTPCQTETKPTSYQVVECPRSTIHLPPAPYQQPKLLS
eukprot:23918_6